MRGNHQIFEIPVYRISRSAFKKETDTIIDKVIWDKEIGDGCKRELYKIYKYPYLYNEVTGWIRVFIDSIQIRGEYYFIQSRNVRRGFKKDYRYVGKAFEMGVFKDEDSPEIYSNVLKRLKSLASEPPFTRRVIDLESFENLGQYINWRKLIDDNLKK
ncbi:hypothetical protein [Paenibacillus sp. FSL H3-0333]|uniref:hypothetical protein n=1 Tax=Paenibacillus sp. FSL H3-0333 TaxID=2921373 RepID=UPI0030F81732